MQNFADYTSLHGFREMYYSKSLLWKVIWFTVVSATLGFSLYQSFKSMESISKEPTTSVIKHLTTELQYPPLTVCYDHWLFWMNFTLAAELEFDKVSVLYALSTLSNISSETEFAVETARMSFEHGMRANRFTKIEHFFFAVSNSEPPGFGLFDSRVKNFTWQRIFGSPMYTRLCYVATNEVLKRALKSIAGGASKELFFMYDDTFGQSKPDQVTNVEYQQYIMELLKSSTIDLQLPDDFNVSLLKFPPELSFDGDVSSVIRPTSQTTRYRVKVSGILYQWLNSSTRPCAAHQPVNNTSDYYCYTKCAEHFRRTTRPEKCVSMTGAVMFDDVDYRNICKKDFHFLTHKTTIFGNSSNTSLAMPTDEVYTKCVADNCKTECIQWRFSSTITTMGTDENLLQVSYKKQILVKYPEDTSVITITEVEANTWETIIGGLGGIIGLWMGASIVSVLQMVYLCCCLGCDEKLANVNCTCQTSTVKPSIIETSVELG